MSIFRGYRILRSDPQWVTKVLVLSAFCLSAAIVPLVGTILMMGWLALSFRRAVVTEEPELPETKLEMDYLGKLLGVGIKSLVVGFVWGMLPGIVVMPIMMGVVTGVAIVGAAMGETASLACAGLGYLSFIPLFIVVSLPAYVAVARAELANDIGEGFKVGDIIGFTRRHLSKLLWASLAYGLLGVGMVLVGILTCGIGFLAMPPVLVITGLCLKVLIADLYRRDVSEGMTPWPTAAEAA